MTLRSPRERLIQILSYEACALCFAVPLYAVLADQGAQAATVVMAAMMLAEMLWAPLHDTVFDFADLRLSGRLASDRPKRWRLVHALSREFTTMVVTVPVIVVFGGHSFAQAFAWDLGLTLMYAVYGYFFYQCFDWVRPVVPRQTAAMCKPRGRYLLSPLARTPAPARVMAPKESQPRAAQINPHLPVWAD